MTEDVISVTVLRRHWGRLLRRVERGQAFTITRNGRVVARLVPIEARASRGRLASETENSF